MTAFFVLSVLGCVIRLQCVHLRSIVMRIDCSCTDVAQAYLTAGIIRAADTGRLVAHIVWEQLHIAHDVPAMSLGLAAELMAQPCTAQTIAVNPPTTADCSDLMASSQDSATYCQNIYV